MTRRLVQQVRATALAVLVSALLATGLATGLLLHWQAVEAHDEMLLAAAHAWSQSLGIDGASPWEAEHSVDPVHLRLETVDQSGLREPLTEGDDEDAHFRTLDGLRELRLPIEIERGAEVLDSHAVIVATAPAVTLASSVGAFVAAYVLVAALVALLGGSLLVERLEAAVAPLARAGKDVRGVAQAGRGARVEVQGPQEVRDLLQEVNDLLDRLDRAFAAQARFTSEAAHELRTPVTVLRGELDLAMRTTRSPEEHATTLVHLSEQVDRLSRLVSGLMALAHIDSGQGMEPAEAVPVAQLVTAAVRQEGSTLRLCGCSLSVQLEDAAAARVCVHEALGIAALSNLLRNVAAHAPGRATRVSAQLVSCGSNGEEPCVVIHVDDAGPGIALGDRDAVFDRLHRGASSRPDGTGLGLGLSLTREVARHYGGDCVATESPLGGARLSLRLHRAV